MAQFRERYNEWLSKLEPYLAAQLPGRASTFDRIDDVQNLRFGTAAPLLTGGTFGAGERYAATEAIRQIIGTATTDVLISDNYTSADTLSLVFAAPVVVTARILTFNVGPDYGTMATRFRAERGASSLETKRSPKDIHDRYLVIDGTTYYNLGASIKDLGKAAISFSRKDAPAEGARIQAILAASWTAATVVP